MTAAKRLLTDYTVDDYCQWDGDWELWDGIAVAMTPSPFGRHQALAARFAWMLQNELQRVGCDATVMHEVDWVVSRSTVVRPDVVVVCGDPPERHLESPPALIAEVLSEATASRDRSHKRELYREQGVGIYFLLDPETETLELAGAPFSGPEPMPLGEPIEIRLCDTCRIRLDPATLFPNRKR